MKQNVIKEVEIFARKYCEHEVLRNGYEDPNLWKDHVRLVRFFSLELAEIENADKTVVEIAALLHDTGKYLGRKEHEIRSYELSKKFLEKFDLEKKELILKCIAKHNGKFAHEDNEIEVKVVQCADALGTLFDDVWQEHSREIYDSDTLLKLFDKTFNKINLESAREIARPKIAELKNAILKWKDL